MDAPEPEASDLGTWSDGDLLGLLAARGFPATLDAFVVEARAAGDPDVFLAARLPEGSADRERAWLAGRELLRRHAPDAVPFEELFAEAEELGRAWAQDQGDAPGFLDRWLAATRAVLAAAPAARRDPARATDLRKDVRWLSEDASELVQALADAGRIEEAEEVAVGWGELAEDAFLLASAAVRLAEAGREPAARDLLARADRLAGRDQVTRCEMAEALLRLGDRARAVLEWERAVTDADADDRETALDYATASMERLGLAAEAARLAAAWVPQPAEGGAAPGPEPVRASVSTGRNDPCPCGSGRKFKKCCGG
ncbi:MAG: SEC-C domain-containing protein [Planctomycetales bacterium]|nr:SEC-C domain-containing protein [Planctomycetales bacterium]